MIFELCIGDYSDDGHGKHYTYHVSSNKPLAAVREAYFTAIKRLPRLIHPDKFLNNYGEPAIPKNVLSAGAKAGYKPFSQLLADYDEGFLEFGSEDMAKYVIWFIMQGNKNLRLRLSQGRKSLHFFGYDKKKRHIGSFGYGLFS